jgi:histidyl-tRNA synthetase
VAVDITDKKPDKQVKTALKLGVQYLLFIGQEEVDGQKFILRNVESQQEDVLDIDGIVSKINN